MTTSQASYLLLVNTAMLVCLAVIAFYLSRGYNVPVKQGATYTPTPVKVDTIEVSIPRTSINQLRRKWLTSGYTILRSHTEEGVTTLTMTKKLDGDQVR